MSTELPILIEHSNLSIAWATAFREVMKPGDRGLRPMVLSIGGFTGLQPAEVPELRAAVDGHLSALGKNSSETSGLTIFPYKMWVRRGRPPCHEFSELCTKRFLPRMRARNTQNRYGTYFGRMMAYTGTNTGGPREVNQLQFIVDLLKKADRPRQSALQVTCFDPAKDHTGQPQRGFPCLQQVSFAYDDSGNLAVNAFYPTQYIFERAYENYLGLCHLGEFVAHEAKLRFSRLTCYIAKPDRGNVTKGSLLSLHQMAIESITKHP